MDFLCCHVASAWLSLAGVITRLEKRRPLQCRIMQLQKVEESGEVLTVGESVVAGGDGESLSWRVADYRP